jgi:anti-sigma B factor antagonist
VLDSKRPKRGGVVPPPRQRWRTKVAIEIERRSEGGWDVLDVAGEVDLSTAPELRSRIEGIVDDGGRLLVVDLADVSFMDSSGLSVLVAGFKGMREAGGRMAVVCPSVSIAKIFSITGLDRVFSIHPSLHEAVSA